MKANLTLTNSDWTAARVRDFLGIEARTLYPPIVDPAPPIPWEQRHAGFIALGRISPEKEYERVIRILARVQSRFPETTLTIVGTWDRHVRGYYKHLRTLAASTGTRVEFRHNLSRDDVRALLASHRYGIHGMREEHFGMAPAEMMTAGMIVWVPHGGGQVEIVGGNPSLTYGSEEAAAEQIIDVLTSPAEQQRLREFLADRARLFTTARFIQEVQEIVRTFQE